MVDVVVQRGTVAELHAVDPFVDRDVRTPTVWWCRPTDDAIVLGSRQSNDLVDGAACARAGLSVAHRRSGGGAVVMRRDDVVWIDAVLPVGTAPDDVRGSMVWVGERWGHVMAALTGARVTVHRGPMQHTPWSDLVCFAGVGPGEVLVGDAKLVGLSQRRSRHGARIQALAYRADATGEYRPLLRGPLPAGAPTGQAWIADLDGERMGAAFATALTARNPSV